jgi:DNA-binding HxlR family transcriptional regulator
VRERRSRGLLALVRWAGRGSAGDTVVRHADNPAARYAELDWQKAQEELSPVRPRWDLAIVSNLNPEVGRRPKDILATVNAQVETEHTLSAQVLSARLRYLEQDGYVRHEDSSTAPLRRVYYLLPRGTLLIDNLLAIVGSIGRDGGEAASAREPMTNR